MKIEKIPKRKTAKNILSGFPVALCHTHNALEPQPAQGYDIKRCFSFLRLSFASKYCLSLDLLASSSLMFKAKKVKKARGAE
jgi:hypothetical protein